jgi:hypothetical protein
LKVVDQSVVHYALLVPKTLRKWGVFVIYIFKHELVLLAAVYHQ